MKPRLSFGNLGCRILLEILFGGLVIAWAVFEGRVQNLSNHADSLEDTLENRIAFVGKENEWAARYGSVRNGVPVFPTAEQGFTYYLKRLDDAAAPTGFRILKCKLRAEREAAPGLGELLIEASSWEGSLQQLVDFLQAFEGGNTTISFRKLRVSSVPERHPMLKGSFLVSCLYRLGDGGTGQETTVQNDTEPISPPVLHGDVSLRRETAPEADPRSPPVPVAQAVSAKNVNGYITVEGALSEPYDIGGKGTAYTLTDATGSVQVVFWNSSIPAELQQRAAAAPRARVHGRVGIYKGDYQIIPKAGGLEIPE